MEVLLPWTSLTCSLEVEEGCRGREKVRGVFIGAAVCSFEGQALSNTTCASDFAVGKNVVHQLTVSLDEMYKGSTRRLGLQKNVICEKCEGMIPLVLSLNSHFKLKSQFIPLITGYGGKKGALEKCSNCKGKGVQIRVQQIGPGMIQQIQSMCPDCQGQGEKFSSKDRCKNCNGNKVERQKKILEVHIDKGMFFPS